ncbi:MAG: GatB/YqeY domain-containing protein [bacterium]
MFDQINEDVKVAMKAQDKLKLSVLRMLKSSLQNKSIELKSDLTDEQVEDVIKKQVKMRNDSLLEFQKFGKVDECEKLNDEIEILLTYLPKQLTDDEILLEVEKMFEELKPTSAKDMGMCMKYAQTNIKNVDMTKVSALIKQKLN